MGRRLAARLNGLIDSKASEGPARDKLIDRLGASAGIDRKTVLEILGNTIDCPPLDRLEAFGRTLNVSLASLKSAAEADGCNYDTD